MVRVSVQTCMIKLLFVEFNCFVQVLPSFTLRIRGQMGKHVMSRKPMMMSAVNKWLSRCEPMKIHVK